MKFSRFDIIIVAACFFLLGKGFYISGSAVFFIGSSVSGFMEIYGEICAERWRSKKRKERQIRNK